jgi:hypothetical protein
MPMILPEGTYLGRYANDTSLTLASIENNVDTAVDLLNKFLHISRLERNWHKRMAFRYGTSNFRLRWLEKYKWKLALERDMSKLLDATFGLTLEVKDVDGFLIDRIQKKIKIWSTIHLPIAGRATIVNSVLSSSLCYFIAIWGSSINAICKYRVLSRNCFWTSQNRILEPTIVQGGGLEA